MIIIKNRLNAGWACHKNGELDQAEAIYRSVLHTKPKHANAWVYFGMVLNDQGRYDEALAAYERALAVDPDNQSAWTNRGNTLGMLGRGLAARESHQKALALAPKYARAHTNLGVELLRAGEFATGWREYEWRLNTAVFSPPDCSLPFWTGESLKNKHLLIHGEQGLGDEIQTARYLAQVAEQGGHATLAADQKLHDIFSRSFPQANIVFRGGQLPVADYQVCGLSLPQHFNFDPSERYLVPDTKKQLAWRADLRRLPGMKVGISWCGNPQNPMNVIRSLPLEALLANLPCEEISIVSLQATHGLDELNALTSAPTIYRPLESSSPTIPPKSIDEMAALIASLDLVISCDSICAHLAPALGVETWLLLSKVPDWRWGLNSTRSPWYKNVRLFRQRRQGDWSEVLQQLNHTFTQRFIANADDDKETSNLDATQLLSENIERKQCRHGTFHYLATDKYIGESLRHYGEFSEHEVELFQQLLSPGDTVVEVGSNIGTHTIPLGNIVGPDGQVLAFEPQRYIFELLRRNVDENNLKQVSVHRMALGDSVGEITVPLLDPSLTNNFGGVPLGEQHQGDQVALSTIDALQLNHCAMIKADVEGMEAAVLRGGENTIKALQPILYLENDRKEKSGELLALIHRLGYRIYEHIPPLYNTHNFFGNPLNLFGNICSINILCIATSTKTSVEGLRELT